MTKFFKSSEKSERPLLFPNYWLMRKSGLLLPNNKVNRLAYMVFHAIGTLFVLTQYMELYLTKSDLDLVLTNLKISMLSTVCVIKANTCLLWQDKWRKVVDYVTKADNFERDDRDILRTKIIDSYTKYSHQVTYLYWILVVITSITVITAPLMMYSSSPLFREELRNGTELFPHIFSTWMPFDKYTSPGCWITVLWHIYICCYGAVVVAAFDMNVVVIMVFFGGKLELLRERCKKMLGDSGCGISDEEAEKTVRQLHTIHVELTDHSRLFDSILSPVMFLYVVMCSLMLCASAFQLTNAQSTSQKLLMAEYLVSGVAQLFLFCWHSNDVLIKSQSIMDGPYESEWWAANARQRKSLLLLAGQFRLNYMFKAGPFSDLSLATFVGILKGSYSYYTLLRK